MEYKIEQYRDLEDIEKEIIYYKNSIGESIIEIGKRLVEVKDQLGEGETFTKWLKERVNFSRTYAYNFIKISKEFDVETVQTFGQSKVFELLTIPKEERDKFIKEEHEINNSYKTVKDMSVRELKKVIKEERKIQQKEIERDEPKVEIKKGNNIKNPRTNYNELLQKERDVEFQINLLKNKKRHIEEEKLRAAKGLDIEIVLKEDIPEVMGLWDETNIDIYIKRNKEEEFIYKVFWGYLGDKESVEKYLKERPREIKNKVSTSEWDRIYTELVDYIPTYKLHCDERISRREYAGYQNIIDQIETSKPNEDEIAMKKELVIAGYKKLSKKYHPDGSNGDNDKFLLLNKIKEKLLA